MARVLVIDDRETSRRLKPSLEESGIAVAVADSGRTGLQAALENPPDIVVLGCVLPDIDGPHVFEALRDAPETAAVRVLMLTSTATPDEIERMESLGVDDYLVEPFGTEELLSVVTEMLETS